MQKKPVYQRRRVEDLVLHQALEQGIDDFYAEAAHDGRDIPLFIQKELNGYLSCGRLEEGFARVHCPECGYDRLVAFSCKGRGFCPSCAGRRMADIAAHLVDNVLPTSLPYRQWVVSFPPPFRYTFAYDKELLSNVFGFVVRTIFSYLKHEAKKRYGLSSVSDAQCGGIAVAQRFGSALNLNLHIHLLILDGVFIEDGNDTVRFLKIGRPTQEECNKIGFKTCVKTIGLLRKQGRFTDNTIDGEDIFFQDEPLLSEVYGASIQGRLAMGPNKGHRVLTFAALPPGMKRSKQHPVLTFDVHAGVAIKARKPKQLERLCRYLTRPPVSNNRFEKTPSGRISVRLKRAWHDGTTHILLTPLELTEKLVALIPPPRFNMIRYYGLFTPRHKIRHLVVAQKETRAKVRRCLHSQRTEWAELMKRVFSIDVLECPRCNSRMQHISAITDPCVIKAILNSVGYPADSPKKVA